VRVPRAPPRSHVTMALVVTAVVSADAGRRGRVGPGELLTCFTVEGDLELLERWRSGDATAGHELFARYFESVYRFFDTKSHGDIDDLVQRTFLACVRARDRFRGEASFRTFLFAIARHELYHHYREGRRDGAYMDPLTTSVAQLVTTPRARLARHEAHRRLVDAMCHLPVDTQMLLELHYWNGLEIPELAQIFGATTATIRTRLHRGRRSLRELLGASLA
jgi:RNA polymerase sigma factor (sigma-70 family)